MHDSLQNGEKEGELRCDCLHENVCIESSSNEVIGKERSKCKWERNMCVEKCEIEKSKGRKVTQRIESNYMEEVKDVVKKNRTNQEYMRNKREYEKLNDNSKFIEKKRERNREYMQKKRDEESLDGNADALLKQRALNKEYMKRKRAEESLDTNSEILENKHALKQEYMKNKRAKENLDANSEGLEKKRALNKEYMKRTRATTGREKELFSSNTC